LHIKHNGESKRFGFQITRLLSGGGDMRYLAIAVLVEASLWALAVCPECADAEGIVEGTLQVSDTAILDTRQLAQQQYLPDCWAHGAAVGARLALIADNLDNEPGFENPSRQEQQEYDEDRPSDADEESGRGNHSSQARSSKKARRVHEGQAEDLYEVKKDKFDSAPKKLHYIYESFPTFSEGHTYETRDHYVHKPPIYGAAGFGSDSNEELNQYMQYFTPQSLSKFTGGGGATGPEHVKQIADRLGWSQAVEMVPVKGQGWGQQGAAQLVAGVMEGMKQGIRFEGFFNRSHAMTIIGADTTDNSIWVTDSNRAGSIRKLNLAHDHVDSMLAFARKDLPDAIQWIHAAAAY
jgi:hypothetical protein